MGKLLEQYSAEYKAAISTGLQKNEMVAKPEVWMMFKYFNDNQIDPWDAGFDAFWENTATEDPEFWAVIAHGFELVTKITHGNAGKELVIDPTGAILMPGDPEKCEGNGEHPDFECCCDECDHYLTCFPDAMPTKE